MIKLLFRVAMFIIGVVLLADIFMPTSTASLQVDQHLSSTSRRWSSNYNGSPADTSYTLRFVGGQPSACSVGYSAYGKLKDGDAVVVQATRLFRNCIRITRGDETIESDSHWKLFELIGGLVLLAVAVGWINTDNDDDDGVRVW